MKKILFIILLINLLCGCSKRVYGTYSYVSPNNDNEELGVTVKLKIKDNKIEKVTISEDTNSFYNVSGVWEDKKTWLTKEIDYLDSFIGKDINEILNINVDIDEYGNPLSIDCDYVTGATQTSGRIILAMQEAIKNYLN